MEWINPDCLPQLGEAGSVFYAILFVWYAQTFYSSSPSSSHKLLGLTSPSSTFGVSWPSVLICSPFVTGESFEGVYSDQLGCWQSHPSSHQVIEWHHHGRDKQRRRTGCLNRQSAHAPCGTTPVPPWIPIYASFIYGPTDAGSSTRSNRCCLQHVTSESGCLSSSEWILSCLLNLMRMKRPGPWTFGSLVLSSVCRPNT